MACLNKTNITKQEEYLKAKNAPPWAITTYVDAALAGVVILIQYIKDLPGKQGQKLTSVS